MKTYLINDREGCYTYSCNLGQEAIHIAAGINIRKEDWLWFPTHFEKWVPSAHEGLQ